MENLAVINTELGISYCAGIEDIYVEVLGDYIRMYDDNMAAFEQLLSGEDWKNYAIRIHGLKSNSLNIGAEELSKLCLALELAGKAIVAGESVDEKIQFIKENHPVAMKVYAAVIENAKDYLG